MLMFYKFTNLKIALQSTNPRNSGTAKVLLLLVDSYPVPLTRPSMPAPGCWHPKRHKVLDSNFLLWAHVYLAPDLWALSAIPSQDLPLGPDKLFGFTPFYPSHSCFLSFNLNPNQSFGISLGSLNSQASWQLYSP